MKANETGELGGSLAAGIGGGGGGARLGMVCESFDALTARSSAAFRVAERRPAGSDDFGLEPTCGTLPDVEGLFPSIDGRGLGPSLTFGFEYWA